MEYIPGQNEARPVIFPRIANIAAQSRSDTRRPEATGANWWWSTIWIAIMARTPFSTRWKA